MPDSLLDREYTATLKFTPRDIYTIISCIGTTVTVSYGIYRGLRVGLFLSQNNPRRYLYPLLISSGISGGFVFYYIGYTTTHLRPIYEYDGPSITIQGMVSEDNNSSVSVNNGSINNTPNEGFRLELVNNGNQPDGGFHDMLRKDLNMSVEEWEKLLISVDNKLSGINSISDYIRYLRKESDNEDLENIPNSGIGSESDNEDILSDLMDKCNIHESNILSFIDLGYIDFFSNDIRIALLSGVILLLWICILNLNFIIIREVFLKLFNKIIEYLVNYPKIVKILTKIKTTIEKIKYIAYTISVGIIYFNLIFSIIFLLVLVKLITIYG